jgi:Caspase domain
MDLTKLAIEQRSIKKIRRGKWVATLFGAVAIFMTCIAGHFATAHADSLGAHKPRKLALLVGINTYQYVQPDLNGAVNDVASMQLTLTSSVYGFNPVNIHVLKNEDATYANIIHEFETHLIAQAKPGDIIVFQFSGHGSQLPDHNDPSGYDNTLIPYDSRDPGNKVHDITDKELNGLFRQLSAKTSNITAILDSCFSGTGLRDIVVQSRYTAPDLRFGNGASPPTLYKSAVGIGSRDASPDLSGFANSGVHYVLIAGARTDQKSYEYKVDGEFHGALTFFLTQELNKPSAQARTYRDIMDQVIPTVNSKYPLQTPQLEGDRLSQQVFGDSSIASTAYVLANPLDTGRVQLKAGKAQGLTAGSSFAVYAPGTHEFKPPTQPLGTIKLDSVDAFTSIGHITSGQKATPANSRAMETAHNYGAHVARIFYKDLATAPLMQEIKKSIEGLHPPPVESTAESAEADLALERRAPQQVALVSSDGHDLWVSDPTKAAASVTDDAESAVMRWAQWLNIRATSNAATTLKLDFIISATGKNEPLNTRPGAIPAFSPKARFDVDIKNHTSRKLFVYILDLSSNGKVKVVYPPEHSHVPVDPYGEQPVAGWTASLGDQANYVRDVLKLLVTTSQVDLDFLEQIAVKGISRGAPPTDPLGRLLFNAAVGAKEAVLTMPDDWTSKEIVFDVCSTTPCGTTAP